jgi:hypothetical protein
MAQALQKTKERKYSEKMTKSVSLVRASMRLGFSTKSDIAEAANMKIWELNDVFKADKELYAEFCVMRKTLVDVAADNLQDILYDKAHPQNFQATKYVLEKYKSDLDSNLEAKDATEIGLTIGGANSPSPVRITFGSKKEE